MVIMQWLCKFELYFGVVFVECMMCCIMLIEIGWCFLLQVCWLLNELFDVLIEICEIGLSQCGDVMIVCVLMVGVQYLLCILCVFFGYWLYDCVKIFDYVLVLVLQVVLWCEVEFGISIVGDQYLEFVSVLFIYDFYVFVCCDDYLFVKWWCICWVVLQLYLLIFVGEVSGNCGLFEGVLKMSGVLLYLFYEVQCSLMVFGFVVEGFGVVVVLKFVIQKNVYLMICMIEFVELLVLCMFVFVICWSV